MSFQFRSCISKTRSDILAVDRIDHGVRCEADPDLIDRLAERGTPLTVCPCSNIMLRVSRFDTISAACTRRACVLRSTPTIRPTSADMSLSNFAAIRDALGFSNDELCQLARNGFTSAFLSDDPRNRYLAELEACRPRRT
jgi:adenosine deaminase